MNIKSTAIGSENYTSFHLINTVVQSYVIIVQLKLYFLRHKLPEEF